jgi:hypothetical protein
MSWFGPTVWRWGAAVAVSMPQFAGRGMPAAMRRPKRRAMQRFWLAALIAALAVAAAAELRAQVAPGEDAAVLAADTALGGAMRADDKSVARKLLSLQFTYADENGAIHERKEFLADLKSVAPAAAADVKVNLYGLVATVTGNRKSALGGDVFFLDIWAKQKGAWRALTMQDVVLAARAPPGAIAASGTGAKSDDCKNPCQTIPYRVRSPAEQDIVNAYQALVKSGIGHDADDWSKHVGEEFVLYRSGRAPIPRSGSIATIERQKENNIAVTVSEIEAMRLSVYGDGAAMIASHVAPDDSRTSYRAASVWAKRAGQWQLMISVETEVK